MSWESTTIGIAAPVAAIAATYFGYKRSRRVDSVSAQLGMATQTTAGQAETRMGQDSLIDNLQTDNALLRSEVKELRAEVKELKAAVHELLAR